MIYTTSELNEMGYTFNGMLGLSPKLAQYAQLKLNHQIYQLFDDDSESAIENGPITLQPNDSRIFGVEFDDLTRNDMIHLLQQ